MNITSKQNQKSTLPTWLVASAYSYDMENLVETYT